MSRIRISTELEEFMISWVHIALIKADSSHRVIELHTSLGMSFVIAAESKQDMLIALLQLERVKAIFPIDGVTVKVIVPEETE